MSAINFAFAGGCSTPAGPTGVTLTNINQTSVDFNVTNALAGTSTSMVVNLSTYSSPTYTTTSQYLSTTNPFSLTGLECNTTYHYTIYNYDGNGGGCFSATNVQGDFTTADCATTPANDNCNNATLLTIGGASNCFSTAYTNNDASGGELFCNSLTLNRCHWETTWFAFEAESEESTILLNRTTASYYQTDLAAFGPYSSLADAYSNCYPTAGDQVLGCVSSFDDLYDPLYSVSFASDSGSFYLIQIINEDCNQLTEDYTGCISVYNTPENNTIGGSDGIDQCGLTYNGTNIGYAPSGGLPGNENLDGNASTTCPTCTSGDEVSYIVNNDSWFYFCPTTDGTWNVDFDGISNCINSNGLQMSIFTGSSSSLTQIWNAASPSAPGSSQTSPDFSVTTGECVYMVVDGFAGDQCDYAYTLNNVTGGCNLLPLGSDLTNFFGIHIDGENKLIWKTANEVNVEKFVIERSIDAIQWNDLTEIPGKNGNQQTYTVSDRSFSKGLNYYRLRQFDFDGKLAWEKTILIDNTFDGKQVIKTVNSFGQEVDPQQAGIIIKIYSDGTIERTFNN